MTSALVVYLGIFLACIGATGVSGCGASQRTKTLQATVISVNTARDGFEIWDLAHQRQLLESSTTREEHETKLAAYYHEREKIISAFEIAYHAIASAAALNDQPSLRAAVDRSAALLVMIKTIIGGP
jgi:hypothetical protein